MRNVLSASAFVSVAFLFVACGGGIQPRPAQQKEKEKEKEKAEESKEDNGKIVKEGAKDAPPPEARVDWAKVGGTARIGDIEVIAVGARNADINGFRFGEFVRMGRLLVVQLRFSNTSQAKRVRFNGWHGDFNAKVIDEHANTYDFVRFGSGFGFAQKMGCFGEPALCEGCNDDPITAGPQNFDPGKKYLRHLFTEKAVDVAKEVRLTLPASELGGQGVVHLRVAIK